MRGRPTYTFAGCAAHHGLRYGTPGAYSVCMGNNTKVRALVAFGLAIVSAGVALFILSYTI